MRLLIFACMVLLFTGEGRAQAFYDWSGRGDWDGRTYEGYDAYSAAQTAYLIRSFGGSDNATLTDSDPGTCGDVPTGLNEACQFSTSYFVQSSGMSPTVDGYMRSYGYAYWLAAPTSHRGDVCARDCVTKRLIQPWAVSLYPRNPWGRLILRKRSATGD